MRPSPEIESERDDLPFRAGLALLVFVAALFVAAWLCLAAGRPLGLWVVAAALAAGIGAARRPAAALVLVAVVGGALLAAGAFYDVSWDGQAYHQEAVLAIAGGWNPLHDGPLSTTRADNLWINHYPKGAWLAEAALLHATGRLEASKALTLILAAAAALLSYAALAPSIGRRTASLLALIFAGNPIVLAQAWTFYVDGMCAALAAALLALALRPGVAALVGQAAALVLLVNLKFTGVVYAAVFCLVQVVLFVRRRPLRAAVPVVAVAIGVLALGLDPYLTNTLRKGHPFYPIEGPGAVDFVTPQLVPDFHQRPRVERLARSLFARSSDRNERPELKAPWSVSGGELDAMAYADTRIGGFGPLFAAALIAALVLAVALAAAGYRPGRATLVAAGALVLSVAVNPVAWWARYVPQLWLLPAGLLLLSSGVRVRSVRLARAALFIILLADQALVLGAQVDGQRRASRAIDAQLAALRRSGAPLPVRFNGFDALPARLRAHGVPFEEEPRGERACPHAVRLVASPAEACLPRVPSS